MEIKIQSIHFDATDKLEAFIEKNDTFRREDKRYF